MELELLNKIATFLSEFISTLLLVYLGCLGCVMGPIFPNSHLQMCLNFGLVIMIMVVVFHYPSGPHMNPSLTVTAVLFKRISLERALIYCAGQMLGGVAGYGLLILTVPDYIINPLYAAHGFCITTVNREITKAQGVLIEFVITATLCLLCCGIWDPRNAKYGDSVAIKFGLGVGCLAITGV